MKGKHYFCGQSPRHADFHDDLFPALFHYGVVFLNHSQSFLSVGNEQWLIHIVENYLFKEVKVNAELITV